MGGGQFRLWTWEIKSRESMVSGDEGVKEFRTCCWISFHMGLNSPRTWLKAEDWIRWQSLFWMRGEISAWLDYTDLEEWQWYNRMNDVSLNRECFLHEGEEVVVWCSRKDEGGGRHSPLFHCHPADFRHIMDESGEASPRGGSGHPLSFAGRAHFQLR